MTRAVRIYAFVAGVIWMFGSTSRADAAAPPKSDPSPAIEQPKNPAAETAGRIIQRMRAAEQRITKQDTGSETRDLQQKVIDDLQALIDAASRMQSQQPQQPSSQSQRQQQPSPQDQQKQQQPAGQQDTGQGGEARRPGDEGISPTEARGKMSPKEAEAARRAGLTGEIWGHLPEALRQKLRNDLSEKTLPGYDDLVRRYFESLAEERKPTSKSSEKKIE